MKISEFFIEGWFLVCELKIGVLTTDEVFGGFVWGGKSFKNVLPTLPTNDLTHIIIYGGSGENVSL